MSCNLGDSTCVHRGMLTTGVGIYLGMVLEVEMLEVETLPPRRVIQPYLGWADLTTIDVAKMDGRMAPLPDIVINMITMEDEVVIGIMMIEEIRVQLHVTTMIALTSVHLVTETPATGTVITTPVEVTTKVVMWQVGLDVAIRQMRMLIGETRLITGLCYLKNR